VLTLIGFAAMSPVLAGGAKTDHSEDQTALDVTVIPGEMPAAQDGTKR